MTQMECVFLLGCCLNNASVLEELTGKVDKQDKLFDPQLLPGPAFMWQALADCRNASGAHPSLTMWAMEMQNRMAAQPANKKHAVFVANAIQLFQQDMSGFRPELARPYITEALLGSAKMAIASEMARIKDATQFNKMLEDASKKMGASHNGIRAVQPFTKLGKFLTNRPQLVLGVDYLDKASHNGMVPGSMVGIVGPSGGGKTIIATNVVAACLKHKRHVVLLQWEQSLEGDIMERICCNITGYPLDVFRGKAEDELPKQVRDKLDKAKAAMGPYLHAFSFADNDEGAIGTLEDVKSICNNLPIDPNTGLKATPFAKLFDWLGAMIEQSGVDKKNEAKYHEVGNKLLLDISTWGKHEKDLSFVFHQSDNVAQGAKSTHKPTKNQVYGIKSFVQRMDYMFSLGTKNLETNVCWLVGNKARYNQPIDLLLRMVADEMTFVDASDDYMLDHTNKFVRKGAAMLDDEQLAANAEDAEGAYGGI